MSLLRSASRLNSKLRFPLILRSSLRKNTKLPSFTAPCPNLCKKQSITDDAYHISLNVGNYRMDDITVKTHQMTVIHIHALQKENNGTDSSFHRVDLHYILPITHDGDKVDARLDCIDCMLYLKAPKEERTCLYKDVEVHKSTCPCPLRPERHLAPCGIVPGPNIVNPFKAD